MLKETIGYGIDSIEIIWQKSLVRINFHWPWATRPLLKSMTARGFPSLVVIKYISLSEVHLGKQLVWMVQRYLQLVCLSPELIICVWNLWLFGWESSSVKFYPTFECMMWHRECHIIHLNVAYFTSIYLFDWVNSVWVDPIIFFW